LSDVARNIENMLKDQPEFSIEVARFQKHHELLYARKLSASQYGFAKLSDLLNFLPDVKLQGSGIAMQAVLSNAVVVFAHQARRVLEGEPGKRLTGCKFAAAFHQTHNRQVKVAEYGYSKLKELVHAVPETLRVSNVENY
jgi:meiosis arrest female protein 1